MTPILEVKLVALMDRIEELVSPDSNAFDMEAIRALVEDEDVQEWKSDLEVAYADAVERYRAAGQSGI